VDRTDVHAVRFLDSRFSGSILQAISGEDPKERLEPPKQERFRIAGDGCEPIFTPLWRR